MATGLCHLLAFAIGMRSTSERASARTHTNTLNQWAASAHKTIINKPVFSSLDATTIFGRSCVLLRLSVRARFWQDANQIYYYYYLLLLLLLLLVDLGELLSRSWTALNKGHTRQRLMRVFTMTKMKKMMRYCQQSAWFWQASCPIS